MLYLIGFLVFSLIASNIAWLFAFHRLVNKLMSRDYGEYVKAEKFSKAKPASKVKIPTDEESVEESRRIADLNSMMGMV